MSTLFNLEFVSPVPRVQVTRGLQGVGMSLPTAPAITSVTLARRYRVSIRAVGKAYRAGDIPRPRQRIGSTLVWHDDDLPAIDIGMGRRAARDPRRRQERAGSAAITA